MCMIIFWLDTGLCLYAFLYAVYVFLYESLQYLLRNIFQATAQASRK